MQKDSPIPYIYSIGEAEIKEAIEKRDEVIEYYTAAYRQAQINAKAGYTAASYIRGYADDSLAQGKAYETECYDNMIGINDDIKVAEQYANEANTWAQKTKEYRDEALQDELLSRSWAIEKTEQNSKYWVNIAKNWATGPSDSSKFWAENGTQWIDPSQYAKDETAKYSKIKIPEFELDLETMTLYQVNYESSDKHKFSIEDGKIWYEYVA